MLKVLGQSTFGLNYGKSIYYQKKKQKKLKGKILGFNIIRIGRFIDGIGNLL